MEENEGKTILPFRHLWIQGFETILGNPLDFLNPKSLQSFNSGELCDDDVFKTVGLFPNLENLNLKNLIAGEDILLEGLEKLTFYCGIFNDEAVKLFDSVWSKKKNYNFFTYLNFYSVLQVL